MNKKLRLLALSSLLLAPTTYAGIVAVPQVPVPVDSPWVISGLILTLAVIGVRLLHSRRK